MRDKIITISTWARQVDDRRSRFDIFADTAIRGVTAPTITQSSAHLIKYGQRKQKELMQSFETQYFSCHTVVENRSSSSQHIWPAYFLARPPEVRPSDVS
jgi:hypothetical protein